MPIHTREYDYLDPLLKEYAALPEGEARREGLRNELVEGFLPIAGNIARRYSGRGEAVDDLEQVASIGLLNALTRYDPTQGRDFLSYAIPTMMGEVRRYFRDTAWSVKTPRSVKERFVAVNAAMARMAQDLDRAPTVSELAAHLGLPREDVLEATAAHSSYQSGSLDEALDSDGDVGLVDVLAVIDDDLEQVEVRALVGELVSCLPRRERLIIVLRFLYEKNQAEIGAEIGISQMRVSRLLTRTLAQLRAEIDRQQGVSTPADIPRE